MMDKEVASLLPLKQAVFHILLAIASGEKHGYGIMKEIEQFTSGRVVIGPGTLYRSIKQMVQDQLIYECEVDEEEDSQDERRRTYCLTDFGMQVVKAEAKRLESLVHFAYAHSVIPKGDA